MKPPETLDDFIAYLSSPLEAPEINKDLYYKPYHSKTDDLIKEILAKRSDGNRTLSPFSLLDSSVIIPPVIDSFKTAYFLTATTYGDYVDLYIHEKPIIKAKNLQSRRNHGFKQKEKVDRSNDYRRRNSIRALNNIRQLTLANFNNDYVKLLTLTFGDCDFDITNPRICNKLLSKFLQKLRKRFPTFKYLGVIEFQKRGAVHYHVLCDLPFFDKEDLATLWGHGFIDIRKPDFMVGSYLFKYLSKTLYDQKLKGVRVYFYSKNLTKPILNTGVTAFTIAEKLKDCEIHFANEYTNKYNGDVIKYRQFKILPAPQTNV